MDEMQRLSLAEIRSQAETVNYIYRRSLRDYVNPLTADEVRAWMLVVVKTQVSAVAACVEVLREDEPAAAERLEHMELELRGLLPSIEQYKERG